MSSPKLIDVPEVDYDTHADILYDLAGQVVAHFRGKHLDDEQVRSILQGHSRQISEALLAQMKRHMWREQTNYRVTRVAAFDQLKPQTFDGSGTDAMRDYRNPPDRLSEIKRFIFVGFGNPATTWPNSIRTLSGGWRLSLSRTCQSSFG